METITKHECPVCFNKLCFSAKIFQCVNGHLLCDTCAEKLKQMECPQCRVKFYGRLNRSLIFEEILDEFSYDCQFSQAGCLQKLRRQDVKEHESSCLFGTSFELCQYLGSATAGCDFKLSVGNAKSFLDHLLGFHPQSSKNIATKMALKLDVNKRHERKCYLMKPFSDRECLVLVILGYTKTGLAFAAVDLSLGLSEEDKVKVTFSVLNEKGTRLSWSIDAGVGIDTWKFMQMEGAYLPHQVERKSLLQYCDEEGRIVLFIRLKSTGNKSGKSPV